MTDCPSCSRTYQFSEGEMPDYFYRYECPRCGSAWQQAKPPVCEDCGATVECTHCKAIPNLVEKIPAGVGPDAPTELREEPNEVTFLTLTALHRKGAPTECSRSPACPFLAMDIHKASVSDKYSCRLFGKLRAEMYGDRHHVSRSNYCINGGLHAPQED